MSDNSSSDQPEFPTLSDNELRETLDLMATAVASMSNRIDGLTKIANKSRSRLKRGSPRSPPGNRPTRKNMAS